ncbi:hypothetical protein PV783_12630 [Chitinophaga sp. CC14]|uniref:hypothetical protein n=1 Tax=Chitinophaga sp. CC14 TaxID=3029199 RepID=UPI003B77FAB6
MNIYRCLVFSIIVTVSTAAAQQPAEPQWIQPDNTAAPPLWGIRNGIVIGLWPAAIEGPRPGNDGGPRGLLRIGYEWKGIIYHLNYIAIEPVVNGKIEFSEISPSRADGKWGKLMWTGETIESGRFTATAGTRGVLSHPDAQHPEYTTLSFYVFMETFENGARPYLRLSISSQQPEELCIEAFDQPGGTPMERCGITATMGNYARLRKLYLKDKIVYAKTLYDGYDGTGFIEKAPYPLPQMLRNKSGDYLVMAQPDESLKELAAWPEDEQHAARWGWRYRPFYTLTQYWRKEAREADSSLQVRVNGRAKYWSGGSTDPNAYINIPGGPSFENFELREKYNAGQKIYFGLTRKTTAELLAQ